MPPGDVSPDAQKGELSACVIGDVMIDIITDLDSSDYQHLVHLGNIPSPIKIEIGGSGSAFAIAARQAGYGVIKLIARFGGDTDAPDTVDVLGQLALRHFRKQGIDVFATIDPINRTGIVMLTHFPDDERLLVADRGANATFTSKDASPVLQAAVETCDILFVSGYALLEPSQAQASSHLMREARKKGLLVVVDAVPHKLYTIMDGAVFRTLTESAHVVISEINTMKRLFFKEDYLDDHKEAYDKVSEQLLTIYNALILTGDHNTYRYARDRAGLIEAGPTNYLSLPIDQRRGFLDRFIATLLQKHYQRFKSLAKEVGSGVSLL